MTLAPVTRSIRRKLMLAMLTTTVVALAVAAVAMMIYDTRTYERSWTQDLTTQAELLARASAPALAFDDPDAARKNLELLRVRPAILAAALYRPNGTLFAEYRSAGSDETPPSPLAGTREYRIDGNRIVISHTIREADDVLGAIVISARYELAQRVSDYLWLLAIVMVAALVAAALTSLALQAAITRPILAVAQIARRVIGQRDFSLRAERTTDDEVGQLVVAFNDMLAEVGRRQDALEASNLSLEREMTERRTAEEALRAADQRKDEFLATLAHELRNPLAPLRNALEILRRSPPREEQAVAAREMMHRQLAQMVRLVDDLLDVSRINVGKLTLRTERVELTAIIRNSIEIVRTLLDAGGHRLELHLPATPIHLDADPTRLAQVFSNVLNNAAKYSPAGTLITLTAAVDGGEAVVSVRDQGLGIAPDMLEAIFGMFTQVDRSLERTTAGLGVGLALARRLVALHGGTIVARSEGLRRGSEFVIRLPLSAADAPAEAPDIPETAEAPASARILLADDNVDFVDSMALLLRACGHVVDVAYDGARALELAKEICPRYAFLDIGLPRVNGYELARRIRTMAGCERTILVAVTGWGQDRDRQQAHAAGFDDHLVKPVTLDDMQAVLQRPLMYFRTQPQAANP